MKKENLNLEVDDLQITPNLNMECLPQMLQECLSVAKTPATRDMLLMSVLTTTSSVMNTVSFRYAHYGKRYYPNLLTFIMAGAASGKGVADLATKLVEPIHKDQPLLIPGDSTYPSFYEQLYEQDGKGLLFETEGSVITDIWKSSCTNYNTALRKCAEHETLSKGRIRTGVTYIEEPKVSVLLHAADAYNQIGGKDQLAVPEVKAGYQKETFLACLPTAFSTGECVKLASQMEAAEKTARRWVDKWVETGVLEKTAHGHYKKTIA